MAGRRLSSNDVSVVIALAIVVLVLLLVYVAERGEGRALDSIAANAEDARAGAGLAKLAPSPESPAYVGPEPGNPDSCGIETMKPGESEAEAAAVADRQRDEAVQAILAALETRSEPRSRAAALYFRAARGRVDPVVTGACKERPGACSEDRQRHDGDSEATEALARLAVNAIDAQVYAWAYRSCAEASLAAAGTCRMVNALQWARLDPANAEPWFAVAREARSRRDAAGLEDAMFHVAAAEVHDPGWGRATAQMITAAPPANGMVVGTWLAALTAISYESLDLSSLQDASRYCEARSLGNANRRDTCEKIATLLADRSTTLSARASGIGLGKRLDWPAARLAAAELERDAAYGLELREAPQPAEPPRCADVRRDLSRFIEIGRLGEVEALRRRVAATGEPIDALAAESRRVAPSIEETPAAQAAASAAFAATAASPYSSAPPPAR